MASTSVLAVLAGSTASSSSWPRRGLAYVATLVVMATGWFVALHILAVSGILFGHPRITAESVIMTSLAGILVSGLLARRIALVEGLETFDTSRTGIPRVIKVVLALAAVPYIAFLFNSLWSFPNGTDAIAYHINLALRWLQGGTMRIDTSMGWQFALPGNAELPALLALSIGVEKAVAIGNMLAVTLLAASVFLIAWRITSQAAPSLLSAVIVTTIPIVIYQTFELYVDLFGAAFLLAAVALLIWREESPTAFTFLSGCAAGIALGVKPVFWTYGSIYGVAALILVLRTNRMRPKYPMLLVSGMLLTSGFWFFRAAVATGNPLYPIGLPTGQSTASAGYAPTSMMHVGAFDYGVRALLQVAAYPWTEMLQNDGRLPVGSDRGTGALFAALAVPGVLFLLVRTVRRRSRPIGIALLAADVAALILWETRLRVPRFGLPAMALSCALAAPMLQELLERSRRVLIFVCVAGLVLNGFDCLVGPAQRVVRRLERHDWSRAAYYGYPPLIDHLPPGTRVFDHAERVWASMLAGTGLTNSVRYQGDTRSGDYILKAGPDDLEDAALRSGGATLIYDGTPPNLYPKIAVPWRIYRIP